MQIRWVCVDLQTMVSFEVHKKCRTRVLEGLNWILQPLPCPENCAMLVLAILLRRLELYRPILRFFGLFHKIRWDLLTTYNIKIRKPNSLLTVWYALRTMDTQREKNLHYTAENSIPILNFKVRPKHILSATSAQFFRYLWFIPSLDVRSPWRATSSK